MEQLFRAYRLPRTAPHVRAAAAALESLGIEPAYVPTGGGSDANALIAAGLPVLNVANGTEHNHQPDESRDGGSAGANARCDARDREPL